MIIKLIMLLLLMMMMMMMMMITMVMCHLLLSLSAFNFVFYFVIYSPFLVPSFLPRCVLCEAVLTRMVLEIKIRSISLFLFFFKLLCYRDYLAQNLRKMP